MSNPLSINRKWLMKMGGVAVAICALAVTCGQAKADTRVGLHLGSYHSTPGYNNTNPGVYVFHNGWTAGTYYNSERNQSYYAGYTWEYPLGSMVRVGATAGVITGYKRADVLPMVVPSVAVSIPGGFGTAARLSFIPPVGGMPTVLHLSVEFRFN